MNSAPKTLIKLTTPSPDNARAPGAKASSTRNPRARRKAAASRATHSENAAHNPYSRGGIRNIPFPPFNCSRIAQGTAIEARIRTTTAADLHGDLETALFSVRSCSDSLIPAPASEPLVGQSIPTIVSRRDHRALPLSALLSLHLELGAYTAERCTFSSPVVRNSSLFGWIYPDPLAFSNTLREKMFHRQDKLSDCACSC